MLKKSDIFRKRKKRNDGGMEERSAHARPSTHKSAAKREEREESIKPIRIGIAMAH